MKKYFTKYLPVEGKILGCKRSECAGMCSAKEPLKSNCDNSGPHKLFLCSLEIQVGDLIGSSKNGLFTATEHHVEKHKGAYFKIIGEVSPAAVWVTEGMEFDEEQVRIEVYASHKAGTYYMPKDKWYLITELNVEEKSCFVFDKYQDADGQYYDETDFDYLLLKDVVNFQCPTCKTFH